MLTGDIVVNAVDDAGDAVAGGGGGGALVDVNRVVAAVVDVVPAEFDCWLSQGRHAKATRPIDKMIVAKLPRTQARRDPMGGDLAGDLAADVGADLRDCGAA